MNRNMLIFQHVKFPFDSTATCNYVWCGWCLIYYIQNVCICMASEFAWPKILLFVLQLSTYEFSSSLFHIFNKFHQCIWGFLLKSRNQKLKIRKFKNPKGLVWSNFPIKLFNSFEFQHENRFTEVPESMVLFDISKI